MTRNEARQQRIEVHTKAIEQMKAFIEIAKKSEHDFSSSIESDEREIAYREQIIKREKERLASA